MAIRTRLTRRSASNVGLTGIKKALQSASCLAPKGLSYAGGVSSRRPMPLPVRAEGFSPTRAHHTRDSPRTWVPRASSSEALAVWIVLSSHYTAIEKQSQQSQRIQTADSTITRTIAAGARVQGALSLRVRRPGWPRGCWSPWPGRVRRQQSRPPAPEPWPAAARGPQHCARRRR